MTDPSEARGERLESWKKIAAYLRRDVRTVQRWEQTNGLPIHRHQRAQRPIPYAYTKELDTWWTRQPDIAPSEAPPTGKGRFIVAAAALLLVLIAGSYGVGQLMKTRGAAVPPNSIAVLPFVDLSEGMANEEFADGVTEELIGRLNKIPGLRVHKPVPGTEIGSALGVEFVLDGSVRKAGDRVRVAARLIRADDTTVVWSESYDRPWSDILTVQDEIASEVTSALKEFTGRSP
jgi:transcriptional activator of cad operon